MGLKRRSFLRTLLAGAAGAALGAEFDIERLLWVPKPIIAVPAMPSHGFVTCDVFTAEALRALENNLVLAKHMNSEYNRPFVGQTVRIRKPRRYA